MDYEVIVGGMAYEEVLHYLPGIKSIKIIMIGPAMNNKNQTETTQTLEMDVCPSCLRDGRKREHIIHPFTYENYRAFNPSAPHLAVAFNCSFHDTDFHDAWAPALQLLMNEETPSIFTSYNQQEAEDDVQILKSLGAIVDENAWRGGRAHLDYFTEECIWHENAYFGGFKGKA